MASKAKVNWLAVRTAYVVKGYTAQRCAEEFQVDITTVKKRASKENWTEERHRNTTQGHLVATEDMRAIVADITAGHVAAADNQVRLAEKVTRKLEEFVDQIEVGDIRTLRSIIEAGARLGEWTDKGIAASRSSRGLRPGEASEGNVKDGDSFTYEWVEAPRPLEAQTDQSQTA